MTISNRIIIDKISLNQYVIKVCRGEDSLEGDEKYGREMICT